MNAHFNSAKLNIGKATDILVQYDTITISLMMLLMLMPKHPRLSKDRNVAFRLACQFHSDGKITTKVYWRDIKYLKILAEKKRDRSIE